MKCTGAYMQGDRKMRYFENDLKTERFVLGKEGQVVQIIPQPRRFFGPAGGGKCPAILR